MNWRDFIDFILSWFRPKPRPAPKPRPGPVNPPAVSGLIAALNAERAKAGRVPQLVESPKLTAFALAWAKSMAQSGVLTHGDFESRVEAAFGPLAAAENIAEGPTTVTEMVADWMNLPGHRANILGPYTMVGTGMARRGGTGTPYWDVVFAS